MAQSASGRRLLTHAAFVMLLAVTMLAARLLLLDSTGAAGLWPAAGVALLWLHQCRRSLVETANVATAILVISTVARVTTDGEWQESLVIALAFTVQSVLAARIMAGRRRELTLRRPLDLGRVALAATVGTVAGAAVAIALFTVLAVPGEQTPGWVAAWSCRNAVGALTIFALGRQLQASKRRGWARDLTRPESWLALAVLVCGLWFFEHYQVPLAFTVLPVMAWIALRLHTLNALLIAMAVGVAIVALDLSGVGPYAAAGPIVRLLYLQLAFAVLCCLTLTLSLNRDDRDRLHDELMDRFSLATSRAHDLEEESRTDALTGVRNRRGLLDQLDEALTEGGAGLLYLDLDRFKPINDRFGHEAGDLVLIEVARRMTALTRSSDVVARLGGDEFAVLCRGRDVGALAALGRRLTDEIDRPIPIAGTEVSVGASIGFTVSEPDDDAHTLLARADKAMYQEKAARATLQPEQR